MISDEESEPVPRKRKASVADVSEPKKKAQRKKVKKEASTSVADYCAVPLDNLEYIMVFPDVDALKKVFHSLKAFIDHCHFRVTSKGLDTQMMDSSHVALLSASFAKEYFLCFEVEDRASMCVRTETMFRALNNGVKGEAVAIYKEKYVRKGGHLVPQDRITLAYRDREVTIPEMDMDYELLEVPPTEYPTEFQIETAELRELLSDLKALQCDVLTIDSIKYPFKLPKDSKTQCVVFRSESIEVGNYIFVHHAALWATVKARATTEKQLEIERKIKHDAKHTLFSIDFAIRYLEKFMGVCALADVTVIKLKEETPIVVENVFGNQHCNITMFLAPKIRDD